VKDDLVTRDEGFRLVTRGFALVSLVWCVGNLLMLPSEAFALLHHLQHLRLAREMGRFVEDETYWTRYYASLTCGRIALTAIDLWLALWLYRGAVGARKFFLPEEPKPVE
jgi:hypothetical protein